MLNSTCELRLTDHSAEDCLQHNPSGVTVVPAFAQSAAIFTAVASPAAIASEGASAQDASALYGRTYNYIDSGQNCMAGGCLSFSEPGRAQILRNGKILYFFGNGRGGYQPQGIALEINRTVNLGSGGRLPRGLRMSQLTDLRKAAQLPIIRYIGDLESRGGTGTVTYDGRRLRAVLDLDFAGSVQEGGRPVGNGRAHWQIAYTFELDGAGRLTGGNGQIQVEGVAQINGAAPTPVSGTGTSTLSPI